MPAQESLSYSQTTIAGNTILTATGTVSLAVAFTMTINATGSYSFTQNRALVHPENTPSNEDDLNLTFNFTVTDGDGDVSAPGSITVTVDDDTPVANGDTQTVSEEALAARPILSSCSTCQAAWIQKSPEQAGSLALIWPNKLLTRL